MIPKASYREPSTEAEIVEDLNVRICNCCECRRQLISLKDWPRFFKECIRGLGAKPETLFAVAARIKDKPYCRDCLSTSRKF